LSKKGKKTPNLRQRGERFNWGDEPRRERNKGVLQAAERFIGEDSFYWRRRRGAVLGRGKELRGSFPRWGKKSSRTFPPTRKAYQKKIIRGPLQVLGIRPSDGRKEGVLRMNMKGFFLF